MTRELVLTVEVLGEAKPAGSKRAFRNPKTNRIIVTDDSKGAKPWKQEIAGTARDAFMLPCPVCAAALVRCTTNTAPCPQCAGARRVAGTLLIGSVAVEFVFYRRRPAGHFGTGRNASQLRPSAPSRPTTRPDVLKLARAVEDALTGVVWRDDAQITEQVLRKFYGEPERTVIHVWSLPEVLQPRLQEAA